MTEPDLFDDIVDDASVSEMRVGQIGTVRGRLDAVMFGNTRQKAAGRKCEDFPALSIQFSDWGQLFITLPGYHEAKGISILIGAYVEVKVQCIDEDATVMALAIRELGNGSVPIPLMGARDFTTVSAAP